MQNPHYIMHIDMDAFFASVEQSVNPSLRGKPVIIGGRNNKERSIICAASYEAKARGIKNAMPSWQALQICPDAIFVPADSGKYIYISDKIFEILMQFNPCVEKFSVDEFFLGFSYLESSESYLSSIAAQIKKQIKDEFSITCSIGIAPTKITAKLAGKLNKPDGLCFYDKSRALSAMRHLKIDKICGIGSQLKKRFNMLGIEKCGDFIGFPDDVLSCHFGVVGLMLKKACMVEDVSLIDFYEDTDDIPKSVGNSQTLRDVSFDREYIESWIYLLSEMVSFRLRKKGLWGRTVSFYISDGFYGGLNRRKTFHDHTDDGYQIYKRILSLLKDFNFELESARVLGVSVSNLSSEDNNYIFEPQQKRVSALRAMDQINKKFGEWTIYPAQLKKAKY